MELFNIFTPVISVIPDLYVVFEWLILYPASVIIPIIAGTKSLKSDWDDKVTSSTNVVKRKLY